MYGQICNRFPTGIVRSSEAMSPQTSLEQAEIRAIRDASRSGRSPRLR
jgi:hypothetical protein